MSKEEQIRASIDNVNTEVLKDTLAILLAKNTNTPSVNVNTENNANYKNFAQAILDLKRKFKFPELDFFTTEADLVYVMAGDRRVLLTERNTSAEIPPRQSENNNVVEETVETSSEPTNSMDDAFENIKPNDSRFSRLEL